MTLEVRFAINRGLVARLLEQLWEGLLVPVKGVAVIHEAILMAMLTGHNNRSTRATDRVRTKTLLKQHSLIRKLINPWGRVN